MKNKTRWNNLPALRRDHDRMRRILYNEGVVFARGRRTEDLLRRAFVSVFLCFAGELEDAGLSCVFCYDMETQRPESCLYMCDGIALIREVEGSKRSISALGLATQCLDRGEQYSSEIAIHEVAHLLFPENSKSGELRHGERFHSGLDVLLAKYNARFGTNLQNDYVNFAPHRRVDVIWSAETESP